MAMSVATIIDRRENAIISCAPTDPVREAARLLAENRIGCLPVLEGDVVAGIFSERDLLYCVAKEGGAVLDCPVAQVMTSPAITIEKDLDAWQALALMTRRRIRHLPVIENGKLTAFVSIGDLVKARIEEIEHEAEQMREYIATA